MELQQLETNQPFSAHALRILVNLNPCLAEDENLLLSYYKRVRTTWSPSAIKTVQKATGLKLTNKLNRCQFAIEAAKQELQFIQPKVEGDSYYLEREQLPVTSYQISSELPSRGKACLAPTPFQVEAFEIEEQKQLEVKEQLQIAQQQIKELELQLENQQEQLEQKQQQLEQSEKFSVLLLANRLLPPGLPLNGTEESPAMRILGSPKTLTELEANYRELIKREHPDVSPWTEEEAINRFAYVRSLYRITREHWHCLKPTTRITVADLEKRMKAPVPFAPESFWAA